MATLKECRVCLDTDNQDDIISPCNCKGTSKWIHKECLYESLKSNQKPCICGFIYKYEVITTVDKKDFVKNFIEVSTPSIIKISCACIIGVILRKNTTYRHNIPKMYTNGALFIGGTLLGLCLFLSAYENSKKNKSVKLNF